jgi:Reverse transcriptase (RNA-dependent DNA polymerase)
VGASRKEAADDGGDVTPGQCLRPVPAPGIRHALEPEWEARFEPRSYGFRPGRGCHDAIDAIYNVCAGLLAKRVWALDADLAAAFDKIDHDHLLAALGSFRPGT